MVNKAPLWRFIFNSNFRIARYLIAIFSILSFFLSFTLPDHYWPWATFYNEFLAFLAILLLLLIIGDAFSKFDELSIVWIGLILWVLLQRMLGVYDFSQDFNLSIFYLFGGFVAYQIGLKVKSCEKIVLVFFCCVSVAAMVNALTAIAQWLEFSHPVIFEINRNAGSKRMEGNIGQANNLGTMVFWGVCSVLALQKKRIISFGVSVFVIILLIFAGSLSGSRTFLLNILLGCLCLLFASKYFGPSLIKFAVIILISTFLFSEIFQYLDRVIYLKDSFGQRDFSSVSIRWLIWSHTLDLISGANWYGEGLSSYPKVSFEYLLQDKKTAVFALFPHNILFDFILSFGLLLTIVVFIVLLFWVVKLFKKFDGIESFYFLLMISGFFTHSLLEFPYAYAFFLLPSAFMMGAISTSAAWAGKTPRVGCGINYLVIIFFAVALYVVFLDYKKIEEDSRLARTVTSGFLVADKIWRSDSVVLLDFEREFNFFSVHEPSSEMTEASLAQYHSLVSRKPVTAALSKYAKALYLNRQCGQLENVIDLIGSLHSTNSRAITLSLRWRSYLKANPCKA